MIACSPSSPVSPSSAFSAEPMTTGVLSPGKLVLRQQLAHLHLDELQQLLVVDHVGLVHEHDDVRHANLARQQDVLARLRHRAVRRRHHQDRPVHLRRTRDHVLHVVGVARAVHVRVVALGRLVLHVRRVDRDPARLLFRRVVDLVVGLRLAAELLRKHRGHRRRQGRLAVINVADRAHVHVGLVTLEFALCHGLSSSGCSFLVDDRLGDVLRRLRVMLEFHRVRRAPLGRRAQAGRVAEHL